MMINIRDSIVYNLILKISFIFVIWLAFCCSGLAEAKSKTKAGNYYSGGKFVDFEGREISKREANPQYLAKINQEIKQLGKVLKTRTDPHVRADLNHRIASLMYKADRVRHFISVDNYEKKYRRFEKGLTKKKPRFPRQNYLRPIKRYQAILARYPKYRKTDEILFELGRLYTKMGRNNGLKYFEQLTARFPASRYALESEFKKAELYFQQRKLTKALRSFRTVLAYGETPYYNHALHKLAWVYYNQGRRRQAVETLKQVVSRGGGGKKGENLKEQALNDLVVFYAEIEGATEEAEAYFARMGKPGLTKKVIDKLSVQYYDQARWEKAILMYHKLIKFDPRSVEVPEYHAKIITAYRKKGDIGKSLQEMENYIDNYYVNKRKWARYNKKDKETLAKVKTEAEKYMRFICKYHHQGAQKNKDQKLYAKAASYYEKYLKYFSKTKQAYEMRYFYAEILYQLADYEKAGNQYERVARSNLQGKYLKKASFAAILCWDTLENEAYKKLEQLRKKQRKEHKAMLAKKKLGAKEIAPPAIDTKPIEPSKYAKRLITASGNFIKWNPRDKRNAEIMFKAPKAYYNYNQFNPAISGFQKVIKRFPRSEVSVFARNLILDIYNLLQDWDNLRLWATRFLNDRYFGPKNRKYLTGLIEGAMFKKAIVLENGKKYINSARLYVELTDKYPKSKLAEKALYNSAINFMLAGRPDLAIENSKRFINRFPKSPLVEKTVLGLARYFENLADFNNAAEYYEMLAFRQPKSKYAATALYNAGLYRENLGQYSKAEKNYRTYIKRYPKRKDASELFFARAMMANKLKKWRKAADLFHQYTYRYKNYNYVLEALYRRGEALINLGKRGAGEKSFRRTARVFKKYRKDRVRLTTGKKYAAKAELRLTSGLVKDYDSVRFKMPQRKLARSIEHKALLLKKLRDKYLAVISYGDAEAGIEALYRIGKAYQKFSSALFSAPVPKGLKPAEVDLYIGELEKRATPIENKAIEAFREAVDKSFKLGILSRYTKLSYEQLSQYKPSKYPTNRGLSIARQEKASALYYYLPVYRQGRRPALNLAYKKPKRK